MCPPYTSHQPLAILHTAPAPMHLLQARLHCHIWTCPSNHVSHCLEEFSPQTSPSGISYPMVGVPSMCPPPPINLWQYSTLHPHPCTCSEPSCTATFGRCRRDNCPLYEPPTESSLGVQSILKSLTLIQHSLDVQNP